MIIYLKKYNLLLFIDFFYITYIFFKILLFFLAKKINAALSIINLPLIHYLIFFLISL